MKELEKRGVATVSLVADHFVADHRRSAETLGLAALPYARMPNPFVNQEESTIRAMIDEGIDDIIAALTTPVRGESRLLRVARLPGDPWLTYEAEDLLGALDAMNRAFLEGQSGDGFPLVPATRARVEEMLAATTRDRGEVLGLLEPGDGIATIEKVAINAVMAACAPPHLPVVIAAVECLVDPQMGLKRKIISTAPSAPLLIVNGPVRQRVGLNHGPCVLGPGARSHANVVIGRAVRLCLMNIGHTIAGVSEMDTIGSPNKFGMCVPENEEHSPWEPLHVQRGFARDESTVSIQFLYGLADLQDFTSTQADDAARRFATGPQYMGVNSTGHWLTGRREDPRYGTVEQEHHVILVAPEHSKIFAKAGWSKRQLSEALFKHARIPFGFLRKRLEDKAIRAGHPELEWLFDSPEALVPVLEDPGCYDIVVAGSPGSNRSGMAWGMGGPVTKAVTRADLHR